MDRQAAKNFLKEHKIKYILAQFVDIYGVAKTKSVPVNHLDMILDDGAGFAGFALHGFAMGPHDADYMAKGDLDTLSILPWQEGYARIVCNGHVNDQPYHMCTRNVLKNQIEKLKQKGWTMNTGLEPELSLLKQIDGKVHPVDDTDVLDKPCYDYKGLSRNKIFLERFCESLQAAGLDVYQIDHEDANGQFEVNFKYADALRSADNYVYCRMAGSEIAHDLGMICSFMPKPFSNRAGNSMHMHISIADSQSPNLFHDDSDKRELGLSTMAYHFLGGLLHHADALVALMAPSVNSYKRLVVGNSLSGATWAPAYISYGNNNRTAMVRIPYGRIELRLADSSCNPYLATAAMIAAGLDGIEKKMPTPEPNNINLYELSEEKLNALAIKKLPQNLNDAIDHLETNTFFKEALGSDFINEFIRLKRMEWVEYMRHVSDWEIQQYLRFF